MAAFNHTMDDSDQNFNYYPYADGDMTGGWSPWFADSGRFRDVSVPGEEGVGQSLQYTAFARSSVTLEFHAAARAGSTIVPSFRTSYQAGTYDSPDPRDRCQHHRRRYSVSSLALVVYDNMNSTLQYSGSWEVDSDSQIPSKSSPKPYRQTSASLASVSLNFTGAAIAINVAPDWGHWTYNVIACRHNTTRQSGPDPTKPHQIELINAASAGMIMMLNDFTVYAPNVSAASAASSLASSQASSTQSSLPATRRREPMQDILAPYYEGFPPPDVQQKSGQTVLSPSTSTLSYQIHEAQSTPRNPFVNQSATIAPTEARTGLSHALLLSPLSPPLQAPVDVDRIIELIAQRIDHPLPAEHEFPPRYPL
ncbi:uncharacterized protein PHACADRAFT_24596 [Phanerochaete carnosa HHB-10118-sp]|uniref:Uncharacterized protein n=1 Tax=Phanerochaete carnosa (strain HHB-10118-sp) TaxID=650164 RepID=K5WQ96_PHACS|nr:uncharacterized protein PHACADRAFT_24596 [Phanerochaete carnosa HHB-10118-sp]EKM61394.1 hypothetical protein PHACADRAFT_24596 [Phanerochaete carnosa HHB-10118-sp]